MTSRADSGDPSNARTSSRGAYAPLPFDPAAYRPDNLTLPDGPLPYPARSTAMKGFPRAQGKIHEWVPGVSTPEGILLVSSTVLATAMASQHSEALVKVLAGVTSTVFAGVAGGLPVAAVWIGEHILHSSGN